MTAKFNQLLLSFVVKRKQAHISGLSITNMIFLFYQFIEKWHISTKRSVTNQGKHKVHAKKVTIMSADHVWHFSLHSLSFALKSACAAKLKNDKATYFFDHAPKAKIYKFIKKIITTKDKKMATPKLITAENVPLFEHKH